MTEVDALTVNVDMLRQDVARLHGYYWDECQRLRRGVAKLKRKRDHWKRKYLDELERANRLERLTDTLSDNLVEEKGLRLLAEARLARPQVPHADRDGSESPDVSMR